MSQLPPVQARAANPFSDAALAASPPASPNPYAPPAYPAAALATPEAGKFDGLCRDGNALVMHKLAPLPPICLKSNQPATQGLRRKLQWHEPWLVLLILAGVLIYVLVAVIMTKRATIRIPLSDEWISHHRRRSWITWGLALGGIALAAIAIGLATLGPAMERWLILLLPAILVLLGAVIYGQYACRLVYTTRITDTHIWLRGMHPGFLDRLPDWPYARR